MKEVMTKKEVCAVLSLSPRQVQRLIAEGKIRASRIGHNSIRVKGAEIERYLKNKMVPA